jgi:hypothetical protein
MSYEAMDKGDNIDDWFTGEGYIAKAVKKLSLESTNIKQT